MLKKKLIKISIIYSYLMFLNYNKIRKSILSAQEFQFYPNQFFYSS